jgi:signal transduction histidine kinase
MAMEQETACAGGSIASRQGCFNWRFAPGDMPRHRRRLYGRLASTFFMGSGVLGLAGLSVPGSGLNVIAAAVLSVAAFVLGIATWLAPWERWPRQASLGLVPLAFVLIALANAYRATDLQVPGVSLMVAFVWLGMAHPPRTSIAMAPFAALAYLLPAFSLHENGGMRTYSAVVIIPLCVLVGEGIAWTAARLEKIELALGWEKDKAERLRELDEMKDKFLSSVSHELRNPITICRGHLDVLDENVN